jgi:hypothetical protein
MKGSDIQRVLRIVALLSVFADAVTYTKSLDLGELRSENSIT